MKRERFEKLKESLEWFKRMHERNTDPYDRAESGEIELERLIKEGLEEGIED
jgi:hypothetical protein